MWSRFSTRDNDHIPLLILVAAVASLLTGCGRAVEEPPHVEHPVAPGVVDQVLDAHLFSEFVDLTGDAAELSIPGRVPIPKTPQQVTPRIPLGTLDIQSIERGLMDRTESVIQGYARNVSQRERQSAQLAVQILRDQSRPVLERELETLHEEMISEVMRVRRQVGPERLQKSFELSILDARIRMYTGIVPEEVMDKRTTLQAELDDLARRTERQVQDLEARYRQERQERENQWSQQMQDLAAAEMARAEQRADNQIAQRRAEAVQSVQTFVDGLRVSERSDKAEGDLQISGTQTAIRAIPDRGESALITVKAVEDNIRQRMRNDAQIAVQLANRTGFIGEQAPDRQMVTQKASRLAGVK